jgi:SAM-dependent methyltransferase
VYQDALGLLLEDRRATAVLPHVRGRLLDVGCGSNQLVRRYGNGMGVDVHPWKDVDMLVSDSSSLELKAETYDTVTFVACLNHIINRHPVIEECKRVLRPGGRIVVTMLTPGISRLWHLIRRPWDPDQRERGMQPGEVYGFTTREMIELFREHGFRLESMQRFMLGMNHLYVFKREADQPRVVTVARYRESA